MIEREDDVGTLRILHVEPDETVRDAVSSFLADRHPELQVTSVPAATAALDHLADVDCVLSAYEMPAMDGLAFLKRVRTDRPDLPFVLFTAAGSEKIAAEAISAGVTDYLHKSTNPEQYTLLANRVRNAATQYRISRALDHQQQRFRRLVEYSSDVVSIVDGNGVFQYLSPAARRVFGYEPDALVGEVGFDYVHPDDLDHTVETFLDAVADPTYRPVITFRFAHPDEGWVVLENTGRNLLDDPIVGGFVINSHDVTERVERAAELERQRDRLAEFADVVSHDLRNPLSVAQGYLAVLEETGDLSNARTIGRALERMEVIIDDLLTLAREGDGLNALSSVRLSEVVQAAWESVETEQATLTVDSEAVMLADPGRLQQLLENLFSNAVSHAGPAAHVRVEEIHHDDACETHPPVVDATDATAGPCGFAVVDDGPGIPMAERERLFGHDGTPEAGRTRFGLSIVRRVTDAHGWTVAVRDAVDGGARFEFHGVRLPDGPTGDAETGEPDAPNGDATTRR